MFLNATEKEKKNPKVSSKNEIHNNSPVCPVKPQRNKNPSRTDEKGLICKLKLVKICNFGFLYDFKAYQQTALLRVEGAKSARVSNINFRLGELFENLILQQLGS